jgi:hypothetical protein
MPVPDFSPGEVLTAAAMDSIGLWRVGGGALSGTTTNFEGVFTSNYTNYLITLDNLQMSATADIYLRMLNGSSAANTADYFWAFLGWTDAGGNVNSQGAAQTVGFIGFSQSGANNIPIGSSRIDVFSPALTARTFFKCATVAYPSGNTATRDGVVRHNLTSSYNGIQFVTASAATMGGNVSIYGYRKA